MRNIIKKKKMFYFSNMNKIIKHYPMTDRLIVRRGYTLPSYLTVESLTVLQDNLIRVRWRVSERDQSAAEEKHVADNDSLGTVASMVAFSKHSQLF
jgi:hypothetical protein